MRVLIGRQAIGRSVKLGTFGMEWAFARRNHRFAKPRECTEGQQPRPQSELSPTPRAREQTEARTRARPGNPETARHRLPLRWRNGLVFDTLAPKPCRSAASVAAKAGSTSASNSFRFAIRRSSAGSRLAVPPAYADVLYAADADAHLQAVGRDAAGRLQYRYHERWEDVRELRK